MSNAFFFLLIPAFVAVQVHNHIGFIRFSQPVPDFVSDLSLKAQYDYKMILENETIPIRARNQQFKSWASTYNVTIQFTQYESQQNVTRLQFERNLTQVISQLSSVNTQVNKILENITLSVQGQKEAVVELAEQQQLSQEVATLLFVRRLLDPQDALSSSKRTV